VILHHGEILDYVWCENCGADGPLSRSLNEAAEKWNSREEPQKKIDVLNAIIKAQDELVEAYEDYLSHADIIEPYDSLINTARTKLEELRDIIGE
jgi:hypothetical protein